MSENYNPFKMWGSYIGVVIAVITTFLSQTIQRMYYVGGSNYSFVGIYLAIIIGFLTGWGIHSLIRKLT